MAAAGPLPMFARGRSNTRLIRAVGWILGKPNLVDVCIRHDDDRHRVKRHAGHMGDPGWLFALDMSNFAFWQLVLHELPVQGVEP